jgi:hypothetical protein
VNQINNAYGLDMHPLRDALYAELHSRPFQVLPSPARVSYLAIMVGPEQKKPNLSIFVLFTSILMVLRQRKTGCALKWILGTSKYAAINI